MSDAIMCVFPIVEDVRFNLLKLGLSVSRSPISTFGIVERVYILVDQVRVRPH